MGWWSKITWWLPRAVLVVFCSLNATAEPQRLLELIQRRLQLSELVARVKWQQKLPIEDLLREEEILQRYPAGEWREFMRAQMEASKQIQRESFQSWQDQPCPPALLDLSQLRSWIDECNQQMEREWRDSPHFPLEVVRIRLSPALWKAICPCLSPLPNGSLDDRN